MGLWKLLTKPIFLPGTLLGWKEPLFWGSRLRGDWYRLVLFVAACFMIGAGPIMVLNGTVMHGGWTGIACAVMLGGSLGSLIGAQIVRRRDNMSGTVQIKKVGVRRVRRYSSLAFYATILTTETQDWPYEAIAGCQLIPSTTLGKSFSLLAIATDESMDMIAVPKSVNLKELVTLLQRGGVAVSLGKSVPWEYAKKKNNSPLLIPFAVTSAAIMLVGLVLSLGQGAGAANKVNAGPADLNPHRARAEELMKEHQKAIEEMRAARSELGSPARLASPAREPGVSPKVPPPPPPPAPPANAATNQDGSPPNNAAPGRPPRSRPTLTHPAFPQGGRFPRPPIPGPPIPGPPGVPSP